MATFVDTARLRLALIIGLSACGLAACNTLGTEGSPMAADIPTSIVPEQDAPPAGAAPADVAVASTAPVAQPTPIPEPVPTKDPEVVDFADLAPTETFRRALQHYNRGEYGLSARYFQATVEKSPEKTAAWIGLAASYDRDRRFDLADRAYATAIKLAGETVPILNNQGYSYMLRGDYKTARAKFAKAHRKDPANPTVVNNIAILNSRDPAYRRGR